VCLFLLGLHCDNAFRAVWVRKRAQQTVNNACTRCWYPKVLSTAVLMTRREKFEYVWRKRICRSAWRPLIKTLLIALMWKQQCISNAISYDAAVQPSASQHTTDLLELSTLWGVWRQLAWLLINDDESTPGPPTLTSVRSSRPHGA